MPNSTLQSKSRLRQSLTKWKSSLHHPAAGPLLLLALTLSMFGDVLFSSRGIVLSRQNTDTFNQYLYWRQFGFEQLRQGHLALWNPYVFSGMPLLGNFQSALLYPVNWVHLILPIDKAINAEIAINVFLAGLWMYFWARHQRLHPLACLVSASLWMFGAPYFLKVYPGHLTPLAAMAWIPLLLLAADWLLEGRTHAACLLGIGALAMQILAGHPQTVYNTVIAVGIYMALRLPRAAQRNSQRARVAAGVLVIGVGAAAIAAAQLGAGWDVFRESTRAGGVVPPEFVRSVALPPENFITLFAPGFFRDNSWLGYWGREYLWELSLFMGVGGFILAVHSIYDGAKATRRYWVPLGVLWLLASSGHTPLFSLLYHFLPGFNKFRGHGRFIVPAAAFFAMLAGIGLDRLLSSDSQSASETKTETRPLRLLFFIPLACGIAIIASGLWLRLTSPSAWQSFLDFVAASRESYTPRATFTQPEFARETATSAGTALLLCGSTLLLWSALGFWRRRSSFAAYGMAILAIAEIVIFARANRSTYPLAAMKPPQTAQFFAQHAGDERYLNINGGNMAMGFHVSDIWGYDPVVLGRYMSFMAWSQKLDPDSITAPADVQFTSYNRLYAMLRCSYVSLDNPAGRRFGEVPGALPHLLLLNKYAVMTQRKRIFEAMAKPDFDPRREVILESAPNPSPAPGKLDGQARVLDSASDSLTIEAQLATPAILLVTDSYSKDWKATELSGSGAQHEYSVLPANYVLRAIPLGAGHHLLQLEYSPLGFVIGKWISLFALIIYGGALVWVLALKKKGNSSHGSA